MTPHSLDLYTVCSMYHTAESNFTVCITPRSQTSRSDVRIKKCVGIRLPLKGHSVKILSLVNTVILCDEI